MLRHIANDSTDPAFNLALEQYVFDSLDPEFAYFMLWRNKNAVIVGKHQNTFGEINQAFIRERDIRVVRRLSGGGAVYHDLGNINYTFISKKGGIESFDFAAFCAPVLKVLAACGVMAEVNGRNDMTIAGKKFSGNAQYIKKGRVMHHGTILYDSDLSILQAALAVSADKIASKGLQSVRSRVTNVKDHMPEPLDVEQFMELLRASVMAAEDCQTYVLGVKDLREVNSLRDERYASWEWNYGHSPDYTVRKERRVEACGKLDVYMDVREGQIRDILFYGDFFSLKDPAELAGILRGCRLDRASLESALAATEIGIYFNAMDKDTFLAILLE